MKIYNITINNSNYSSFLLDHIIKSDLISIEIATLFKTKDLGLLFSNINIVEHSNLSRLKHREVFNKKYG